MGVIETENELCDLMCNNNLRKPKVVEYKEPEQWWVFTFGVGQPNGGHYVKFFGTHESARAQMVEHFGRVWSFQYTAEEWDRMVADPKRKWKPETEIALEDCVCRVK